VGGGEGWVGVGSGHIPEISKKLKKITCVPKHSV